MFESIETSTTLGFPDIVYGHGDVLGVAELKEISRKPLNRFTVPWRPGQLAWYKNYRKKYSISTPYLLILTIVEDWFIIDDIKETYNMHDITHFYLGKNKDLMKNRIHLYNYLFSCWHD